MASDSTLHRLFCQNLRALRKAHGLTQAEVAERLGMPQPQYAIIESGKHAPTLATVERISVAIGVPVLELLSPHRQEVAA